VQTRGQPTLAVAVAAPIGYYDVNVIGLCACRTWASDLDQPL
jgi:hypothetical protein